MFLLRTIVVVIVVITVFIALFLYCTLKFIQLFGYLLKRYWNCYFTALATRKWLYPVSAIWPVFCYDLCYVCDCGFVLADKFIKVK